MTNKSVTNEELVEQVAKLLHKKNYIGTNSWKFLDPKMKAKYLKQARAILALVADDEGLVVAIANLIFRELEAEISQWEKFKQGVRSGLDHIEELEAHNE